MQFERNKLGGWAKNPFKINGKHLLVVVMDHCSRLKCNDAWTWAIRDSIYVHIHNGITILFDGSLFGGEYQK